jgi:hypothetical protein
MIPKFGLFSPYTLRFHAEYNYESKSSLLKRSMILFDQLVYVEPGKHDKGFVAELIHQDSTPIEKEVVSLFKPVMDFVTDDALTDMAFTVDPSSNLWYGPNSAQFLLFMKDFLTTHFGFDAYNVKNAQEFEILDYYVTALSADFTFLFQMSQQNKDISALYTQLHRDAYFATYGDTQITAERVLQKVCSLNFFDFGKLTWGQILELRQSHFLQDFRIKFQEWLIEYKLSRDESDFSKKMDLYLKASNFEFLRENQPKVLAKTVAGIVANIPLGIIGPIISIYDSGSQLFKDVKSKKDFGWLFFIQEAFYKSNQHARK